MIFSVFIWRGQCVKKLTHERLISGNYSVVIASRRFCSLAATLAPYASAVSNLSLA
jgi:hypothetical protein